MNRFLTRCTICLQSAEELCQNTLARTANKMRLATMDWKSFLTWISNKRRTRRPLLVLTIRDDVNIEAMYTKCVPTGLHSRLSRVLEFDRIESMK